MILDVYQQLQIFSRLFNFTPTFKKKVINPFRSDKNPSCEFYEHNGVIYFKDWAKPEWTSNCINLYLKVKNITFETFKMNMNTILKGSDIILSKSEIDEEIKSSKVKKEIIPIFREQFSKEFLEYWKTRGVTTFENVKEVEKITIKKEDEECTITKRDLCIYYQFQNGFKLYSPYSEKKFKFLSQVKKNDVWWYQDYPVLLIVKASKDFLVIKSIIDEYKLPVTLTHIQSEVIPKTKYSIPNWEKIQGYERIMVIMDNDDTGRAAAESFKDNFNAEVQFTPFCKDPDELYVKHGKQELVNFLKKIL